MRGTGCPPIEHLARVVFLGRDWRKCYMAFAMYSDASGGLINAAKVISGYIASVEDWQRFDTDWKLTLAHDNVPYFHMKEFAHFKGPYSDWKGQDTRRANFLARLVSVTRDNLRCRITSVVGIKAFADLDREYMLTEGVDGVHALAARTVVRKAREWMNENHRGEPWKVVFESGDTDDDATQSLLRVRFKNDGFPIPSFEPKKDENGVWFTPFQAADFAAWEFRKFTQMRDDGFIRSLYDVRKSFMNLSTMRHKDGVYEKADLLKMCKAGGVPRRTLTA